MRILTVFGVVCMALAMAGCSADQPLDASSEGGAGDTIVRVQATATVPLWNVWGWTEDANHNGQLDAELDDDHDGRFDTGEDVNHNGQLDPGEDRNANGRVNFDEDFNSDGLLERSSTEFAGACPDCEDSNFNCVLDPGEDKNGDGILYSEDVDCDGFLDGNEDTNHNNVRDFEDTVEANAALDAGVWCEDPGLPTISGLVPVPISGDVLLYRQGNPTPEVLASETHAGGGVTPYDDRVFATFPTKTVGLENGFQLQVTQGQQLAAGASRLAQAPLAKSPGAANFGLCTVHLGLGPSELGGTPLPITTVAAAGDTIVVRVQSKTAGTFPMIPQATSYAVGGSVTKNGTTLATQGAPVADLGQPVSFHVVVP